MKIKIVSIVKIFFLHTKQTTFHNITRRHCLPYPKWTCWTKSSRACTDDGCRGRSHPAATAATTGPWTRCPSGPKCRDRTRTSWRHRTSLLTEKSEYRVYRNLSCTPLRNNYCTLDPFSEQVERHADNEVACPRRQAVIFFNLVQFVFSGQFSSVQFICENRKKKTRGRFPYVSSVFSCYRNSLRITCRLAIRKKIH